MPFAQSLFSANSCSVRGLIRQLRNCFFYFNGVQLVFPLFF